MEEENAQPENIAIALGALQLFDAANLANNPLNIIIQGQGQVHLAQGAVANINLQQFQDGANGAAVQVHLAQGAVANINGQAFQGGANGAAIIQINGVLVAQPIASLRCVAGEAGNHQNFAVLVPSVMVTANDHSVETIHEARSNSFNITTVMRNAEFPMGTLKLVVDASENPFVDIKRIEGNLIVDLSNVNLEYMLEHPANFVLGENFNATRFALEALWHKAEHPLDAHKIISFMGDNVTISYNDHHQE